GRVEGIRKKRLGFRIERIDRNGALAESLVEDRLLVDIVHKVRPPVHEEKRAYSPRHDRDRTEYTQVIHRAGHDRWTTGGTLYSPSRTARPGRYTRSQSMKLPVGAGSQFDSCPMGIAFLI